VSAGEYCNEVWKTAALNVRVVSLCFFGVLSRLDLKRGRTFVLCRGGGRKYAFLVSQTPSESLDEREDTPIAGPGETEANSSAGGPRATFEQTGRPLGEAVPGPTAG
jgi:hypothetical protein